MVSGYSLESVRTGPEKGVMFIGIYRVGAVTTEMGLSIMPVKRDHEGAWPKELADQIVYIRHLLLSAFHPDFTTSPTSRSLQPLLPQSFIIQKFILYDTRTSI